MFKVERLNADDLLLGPRSRSDLSLDSFSSNSRPAITKTYHEPKLRSILRRKIIANLIDHDYIAMSPEENIQYEVERLRKFASKGILVPEVYHVGKRSYTMELIPHATAEEHLRNGKTEVVDHILLAVDRLHATGATHGDFFPANIIPVSDENSVLLDPGVKYGDEDTMTGRFRDLTQALFRIGHFIPEMTNVLKALQAIYHNQEDLTQFYQFVKHTSFSQGLIINIVFKDFGIFERMTRAMKEVFGKSGGRKYYY